MFLPLQRAVITNAKRAHAKQLRTHRPSIKSTRVTTVSFQHKAPRAGALKAVKQPLRPRVPSKQSKLPFKRSKRPQVQDAPMTPTRRSYEAMSEDESSPNITPASLRSASKKTRRSSITKERPEKNASIDSKSNQTQVLRKYGNNSSRAQLRHSASSSDKSRATSASVEKRYHASQDRSRGSSGRRVDS